MQLQEQNSPEWQLLNELLKQRSYDSTTVGFFWQSPAFHHALQENYPNKTTFRLLENYLLSPTTQREKVDILTLESDTSFALAKLVTGLNRLREVNSRGQRLKGSEPTLPLRNPTGLVAFRIRAKLVSDKKTVTERTLRAHQSVHAAELRNTTKPPSLNDVLHQAQNIMIDYVQSNKSNIAAVK